MTREADVTNELANFRENYLRPLGWLKSIELGQCCNDDGPIPWLTYPATRFLESIVKPNWRVFEFGCGSSSLWWASRVREVLSVEHDDEWATKIRALLPDNGRIIHAAAHAEELTAATGDIEAYFEKGF